MSNKTTFAQDFAAMMEGWNKIMTEAKAQFPQASQEELQKIVGDAFRHTIGWDKGE